MRSGDARKVLGTIFGVTEELGRSSRAIATLTSLGAGRHISDHTHANPYLSLHLLGGYGERGEDGEIRIASPAAIFHPAGSAHEMGIGAAGLATVIVELDRDWLRRLAGGPAGFERSRYWVGGRIGRRATALARTWLRRRSQADVFRLTEDFLTLLARSDATARGPNWLESVEALTSTEMSSDGADRLAARMGVTRPWLFRAYRRYRGEGLGEAIGRHRVEKAILLIESTNLSLASVAADAGFCDQSHMNRAFNLMLGITPATVRQRPIGLSGEKSISLARGVG